MKASQLITTIKSGNVYLNLFLKEGDCGPFLEPSRPVHRYKDKEASGTFSEYLRDQHRPNAARCYERAHDFIEDWKSNRASSPTREEELGDLTIPSDPN